MDDVTFAEGRTERPQEETVWGARRGDGAPPSSWEPLPYESGLLHSAPSPTAPSGRFPELALPSLSASSQEPLQGQGGWRLGLCHIMNFFTYAALNFAYTMYVIGDVTTGLQIQSN